VDGSVEVDDDVWFVAHGYSPALGS
jgi:hypothetical protein